MATTLLVEICMIKPIGQTAVVKIADNDTVIIGNVLQYSANY